MDAAEILKKIRTLEIKTRGLTNQIFSGEYHSAYKGRGMAFSEVRERPLVYRTTGSTGSNCDVR